MKLARLMMSGIALVLVAAACGDDPVEPEDQLTKEEAVALFESRSSLTSLLSDSTNRIHLSPDSSVYRCAQGGQVKAVFTEFAVDTTLVDTTRIVVRANVTPRECEVTGDGLTFTLDGDPTVRETLELNMVGIDLFTTGSVGGGLKWKLEDRSGSCEIDLTLSSESDDSDPANPKQKFTYKGSLCGHEVEIVTTVDIVLTG